MYALLIVNRPLRTTAICRLVPAKVLTALALFAGYHYTNLLFVLSVPHDVIDVPTASTFLTMLRALEKEPGSMKRPLMAAPQKQNT